MGDNRSVLRPAEQPLDQIYDLAALDLDGVVYVGEHAVPGAVAGLEAARRRGMHLAFITNNASRPPAAVAARLRALGIHADAYSLSAQALAILAIVVLYGRSRLAEKRRVTA